MPPHNHSAQLIPSGAPSSFPWTVPVPVRTSHFVPLCKNHSQYNIEVDLSRIRPFQAVIDPMGRADVLFVDLQDSPVASQRGRLGSGRAGFYRTKYLKGVGRTLLAGNWNDSADLDHSTGHLLASGGIREYLVTVYLQAKGLTHIVNGVEGVLIRPKSRHLRHQFRARIQSLSATDRYALSACSGDQMLQALTVKDAPFARFSNLIWLLNHVDFGPFSMLTFDDYFRLFANSLGSAVHDPEILLEPESLLDILDYTIEKTIDNFRQAWTVGVFWGSIHNNFCMDGRFLDLEWPVILGAPLPGIVAATNLGHCDVPSRSAGTGLFEVVRYIRHVRAAYLHIMGRLDTIVSGNAKRLAREYCAELLQLMRYRRRAGHQLFSVNSLNQRLWQWVSTNCDVALRKRTPLRKSIRQSCLAQMYPDDRRYTCRIPVLPLSLNMARLGFTFRPVIHVLDGASATIEAFNEGTFINELIDKLDHETDVDRLLAGLQAATDEIHRRCSTPSYSRDASQILLKKEDDRNVDLDKERTG